MYLKLTHKNRHYITIITLETIYNLLIFSSSKLRYMQIANACIVSLNLSLTIGVFNLKMFQILFLIPYNVFFVIFTAPL